MIVELSHFALALALALTLGGAGLSAYGAVRRDGAAMAGGRAAVLASAAVFVLSFLGLIVAFAGSDFSVVAVADNSHSDKPLVYKIAAAWGHHEGSMLLWCAMMALYGAVPALNAARGRVDALHAARVLSAHGVSTALFAAFLVFTSNPFERVLPAPADGRGLNPLLQDPALAAHPPMLYAGYIGFSIVFAHAVAGLWAGRIDRDWARMVRPWALFSWIALTVGIALGSFWAYYELGWGGWWAWDPVENASLAPWLLGAALIHTVLVTARRGAMTGWTTLLAILTFSMSVLGTFLVRSGVLTSVHAFANDPARGAVLLVILAVLTGGALALYAVRAPMIAAEADHRPVSRESALVLNNFAMALACFALLLGTMYPLFVSGVSVGPPFFNLVIGAIVLPALLVAPIGPFLAWRKGDGAAALRWAVPGLAVAAAAGLLAAFVAARGTVVAALALALGVWLLAGALTDPVRRAGIFSKGAGRGLKRLAGLPLSTWASSAAHGGLGLLLIGAVGAGAWQTRLEEVVPVGGSIELAGRTATLERVVQVRGPNYVADRAVVRYDDETLEPERRYYPAGRTPTTEIALKRDAGGQAYIALGDPRGGGVLISASYFPLVDWIYIGGGLMALGGVLGWVAARREAGRRAPA
ncbi:MAG: heme lyase CcmF/NrfE family subunit [Pseudomonadota bacterium]